jgi:hypothetical protein
MDAWDRLLRIAPPPASPRHASGDWSMAERVIGASFPPDYRRLVGTYGLGTFGEFVYLRSPPRPRRLLPSAANRDWDRVGHERQR